MQTPLSAALAKRMRGMLDLQPRTPTPLFLFTAWGFGALGLGRRALGFWVSALGF